MSALDDMRAAVAWRVEALGGKFVVGTGAWQMEPALPPVGSPERAKLEADHARTVAGLLAGYRRGGEAELARQALPT